MEKKEKKVIGIDVSKASLDICIKQGDTCVFEKIDNTIKSIKKFFKPFENQADNVFVAMENTGRYNNFLYDVLEYKSFTVYVINPIHIHKSLGLSRGKDDKTDAKRIAIFTEKNRNDLPLWKPDSQSVKKLKLLVTERKAKTSLTKQKSDYALLKSTGMDKKMQKLNKELIAEITLQIKKIEAEIEQVIKQDEALNDHYQRIQTIPGVGKVLSCLMLTKTQGFTKIDTPRKTACYAGVVPSDYQSGSSLRHKPKVSIFADKDLKTILHMAALSAIRLNNDLRKYYLRKVEEGKNKMCVLNAIRNKIIHHIFALIKNKTFEVIV